MRIRKKKWVAPFLENEERYLVRGALKNQEGYKTVYLELGMGMGDFIAQSAIREPEVLFIGYEKEATCVAKAIQKFEANDLKNVKVILADVKDILDIVPLKVDRIYLQFSDPWPKSGYQKRRLTHENFLKIYDQILKDDGLIVFKTDNSAFFDFSIMSFLDHGYKMVAFSTDRHRKENDDVLTGYESKFIEKGMPIYFASFKKGQVV